MVYEMNMNELLTNLIAKQDFSYFKSDLINYLKPYNSYTKTGNPKKLQ